MRIRATRLRRAALAAGAVTAAGLAGCQSTGTHFAQGGVARGETYANSSAVAQKQSGQPMIISQGMTSGQMNMSTVQPGMMMPGQALPANQTMTISGPPMVGSGGTVYPVNYTPATGPQMMQVMPSNFTPPASMQSQQQVTATVPMTPGAIGQPTIMVVNGPNGPQYVITEMVSQSPVPTGAQMMPAPTMAAPGTFMPAMPTPMTVPANYSPPMPAPVMPASTMPAPSIMPAPVMPTPAAPSAVPAPITPVMTPPAISDVSPAPLPATVPAASPAPAPTPMPPPAAPTPPPTSPPTPVIPAPAPMVTQPTPIESPTPPTSAAPSGDVSFKAPNTLPPDVNYKLPAGSPAQQGPDSSGPAVASLPPLPPGPFVPAKLPPAKGTAADDEISSAPVFVPVAR